jgi:hypothetical protein
MFLQTQARTCYAAGVRMLYLAKPPAFSTKSHGDGHLERLWYDALLKLDKNQDTGPLVSLLQSGRPSDVVSFHIGDVFTRYDLRKKHGRPRVPSYDMSDAERTALRVSDQVRDLAKGGMKVKDAIAKVAEENKMAETTVANAYAGRRGSTRRVRQRMLKPTKPSKG